jgi:hypothetical protein
LHHITGLQDLIVAAALDDYLNYAKMLTCNVTSYSELTLVVVGRIETVDRERIECLHFFELLTYHQTCKQGRNKSHSREQCHILR